MAETFTIAFETKYDVQAIVGALQNFWHGDGYEFSVKPTSGLRKEVTFALCTGMPGEREMQREVFRRLIDMSADEKVLYFRNPDFEQDSPPTVSIDKAVEDFPPDDFERDFGEKVYVLWVVRN